MFSYSQIARWLTFPIDPITVEDWVANREIFGPASVSPKADSGEATEEELEMAYQVEKLRAVSASAIAEDFDEPKELSLFSLINGLELSGLVDRNDFLMVAPSGHSVDGKKVAEAKIEYVGNLPAGRQGKPEKIDISGGTVQIVDLDPTRSLKIQINLGSNLKVNQKSTATWSGAGKRLLIVDVRGRPLPDFGPGPKQQEMMKKMHEKLASK